MNEMGRRCLWYYGAICSRFRFKRPRFNETGKKRDQAYDIYISEKAKSTKSCAESFSYCLSTKEARYISSAFDDDIQGGLKFRVEFNESIIPTYAQAEETLPFRPKL